MVELAELPRIKPLPAATSMVDYQLITDRFDIRRGLAVIIVGDALDQNGEISRLLTTLASKTYHCGEAFPIQPIAPPEHLMTVSFLTPRPLAPPDQLVDHLINSGVPVDVLSQPDLLVLPPTHRQTVFYFSPLQTSHQSTAIEASLASMVGKEYSIRREWLSGRDRPLILQH
jgi:hypothetical protein